MKNKFIVTSHGWSASNWTAHALNLNEHVLCVHSARIEIANDIDLQSNANLKKNIDQLQSGYLNRQARSLDDLYEYIISKGTADVYGSVHVLRLRDLPVIFEKFGTPGEKYTLANVVRNPVDLVWSGYGQFRDLFRYDINELYWTTGKVVNQALEFANKIGRKYDLNLGDFENLAFFGACAVLESLRKDIDAYELLKKTNNIDFVGTFKMEELTSSRSYFQLFAEKLGLGRFVSPQYIDAVFNTGIVNKHKYDSKKLTSLQRFESFSDWQKEVFIHFFKLHNLTNSYSEFGYDLDFID